MFELNDELPLKQLDRDVSDRKLGMNVFENITSFKFLNWFPPLENGKLLDEMNVILLVDEL